MNVRRLSGNALASASYVVGSALLLFELYRYLAQQLGAAQIGVWALVTASSAIVRVSEFGVSAGVVRYVAADIGEGRRDHAAATAGMALFSVATIMGLVSLILYPVLALFVDSAIRDPEAAAAGHALLPWAIASLWLVTMTNVFVGVLDGQQRAGLRSVGMLTSNAIQIVLAWILVPRDGLAAMGPVQLGFAASGFALLGVMSLLTLRQPLRAWFAWDRRRFAELFRFGGAFQIMSLFQVLFEPTTKWLLSVFGGLEAAGYFEMVNRAIQQLRQVIVAGLMMLVPHVAATQARDGADPEAVRVLYRQAFRMLLWIVVPYLTLIGCLLPAALTAWVGHYSSLFITIGVLCLIGWGLNLLAVPAYSILVGVGQLRWVVASQVVIALVNLILSAAGGYWLGAYGVVAGAMAALAVGSMVLMWPLHRDQPGAVATFLPQGLPIGLAIGSVAIAASLWLGRGLAEGSGSTTVSYVLSVVSGVTLVTLVAWRDPIRGQLLARFRTQA